MRDTDRIVAQLLGGRMAPDAAVPPRSGVYAIFAAPGVSLPPLTLNADQPLYVGMTDSSLEVRNHFAHANSGFSTLRRSLGALLRDVLGLRAIPRGGGPSQTNIRNFRFDDDGERRLSNWMGASLTWNFAAMEEPAALEAALITALRPPLNLTGWPNPDRDYLKRLRKSCTTEAALARSREQDVSRRA